MKINNILWITILFFLGISSYVHAQDNESDIDAIKTIKDFYTAYSKVKFIVKDFHRIDSIQKRYSTLKLRKEATEWFRDGHDIMTNDYGIDKRSIANLTVKKNTGTTNAYIVSYLVIGYPVSPNKPVNQNVTLNVTVIKEGNLYKIRSVR